MSLQPERKTSSSQEDKTQGAPRSFLDFFHQKNILQIIEQLMILIGISGQSLFYFQAYKIYSIGSANDVSTIGFSFALFSLVAWLLYGLLIKNKVLILVNAFAVIGATLTLFTIFLVS
jgi:MtN3 and saliva related transmembrane protein